MASTVNWSDDRYVQDIENARLALTAALDMARQNGLHPAITEKQFDLTKPIECVRRYVPKVVEVNDQQITESILKPLMEYQDQANQALHVPDDEVPF